MESLNVNERLGELQPSVKTIKLLGLFGILIIAVVFGMIPAFWKLCRRRVRILGLANVFTGGLFLSTALFHLLPQSYLYMSVYLADNSKDSNINQVPLTYFICFFSFSIILFIEKVTFDSKVLEPFEINYDDPRLGTSVITEPNDSKIVDKEKEIKVAENKPLGHSHDQDHDEDSESDEEEDVFKNILSTKGKMASFLQTRNLNRSMAEGNESSLVPKKHNKSLLRSSQLIRSFAGGNKGAQEDMSLFVDPKKVHMKNNTSNNKGKPPVPMASFTPYLLIVAISFHGIFEGLALGIQKRDNDCIYLLVAIVMHKIVDSFTLGIALIKANTERTTLVRLIILFSLFTPFGIILGYFLDDVDYLSFSILLAVSAGTFVYISTSDIIVEEFSFTTHRFTKFCLYLLGGIFMGSLITAIKLSETAPFKLTYTAQ